MCVMRRPGSPGPSSSLSHKEESWSSQYCGASHRRVRGGPGTDSRNSGRCSEDMLLEGREDRTGDRLLTGCTARTCCSLETEVSGPSDQWLLTVLVDVVVGGEVGEEVLAVWDQAPVIVTVWVEGRSGARGEPGLLATLLAVRPGQQHAQHQQLHHTHHLSRHQAYV